MSRGRWGTALLLMLLLGGCGSAERHLLEGNRAYGRGQREVAEVAYQKALQDERTRPVAQLNLGRLYLEEGQPEVARTWLDQGLAARPELASGYLCRGKALLELGELEAASRDFQKATLLGAPPPEEWLEMTRLRQQPGRALRGAEGTDTGSAKGDSEEPASPL